MTTKWLDNIFLWILAWLVPYTVLIWALYLAIFNRVAEAIIQHPDYAYAIFHTREIMVSLYVLGLLRNAILIPYLYGTMIVTGLALVWLPMSWMLNNGWEAGNDHRV